MDSGLCIAFPPYSPKNYPSYSLKQLFRLGFNSSVIGHLENEQLYEKKKKKDMIRVRVRLSDWFTVPSLW